MESGGMFNFRYFFFQPQKPVKMVNIYVVPVYLCANGNTDLCFVDYHMNY